VFGNQKQPFNFVAKTTTITHFLTNSYMRNEQYDVESTPSFTTFEFISEGRKGKIRKVVQYTELANSSVYNLGFGDKIDDSDDFNDKVITDNGDSLKVLNTVAATVYDFLEHYPQATVFATGSTFSRTRLYRIGISNALDDIKEEFYVLGYLDSYWEPFEPNRDYTAFSITKKTF
jgi:hypothetical protein